ncbi:MAG: hypothetical protein D3914_00700 [Candidatus Electrothrix sp. LOE2]|nr:hypothetical protein [Candidatus Electrothrix sp. LOE2]
MQFDTFLFDAFSQLSGGLITDLKTLLLGLLFLGMILIGADMLFEKLEGVSLDRRASGNFRQAETYRTMRDFSDSDSLEYDYYNALYRKHLSASVGISSRTGKNYTSTQDKLFS